APGLHADATPATPSGSPRLPPAPAKPHRRRRGATPLPRRSRAPVRRRRGDDVDRVPASATAPTPMKDADVVPFFETLRDANPEPASELDYTSVFELLIAVLLSAQTTDKRVNQVTKALFAAGPTPAKMLALGAETIESM